MDKKKTPFLSYFIALSALLYVAVIWINHTTEASHLVTEVNSWTKVNFFENKYFYFFILAFSFIPVFLLSFDKRVHYYTIWKKMLPHMTLVAISFIMWDVFFTYWKIWGFNSNYYLDLKVMGLPIEEILFFFIVPFACLFIYKCLEYYFPKDILKPFDKWLSLGGGFILIILGLYYHSLLYTTTTLVLTGATLIYHYIRFENTYRTRFYLTYLVSWIPFLIVNGALTGAFTHEPVVLYNPNEFLNLRIGTVPFEDSIYALLLLILNVMGIEENRVKTKNDNRINNGK